MVLSYAYCNVSIAPIHRDPAHRSEQTSQLLFGEKAEVLEIGQHDWARIRSRWDGYEGWAKASQLQFIQPKDFRKPTKHITEHHGQLIFDESKLWLPAGSELTSLKHGKITCGDKIGKYKGRKQVLDRLTATPDAVIAAAHTFLTAPYQWGGRSIAGIDCSGLVQMAYKLAGQAIVRDAAQQATVGQTVDFLAEGRAADLAFFDNEEGKITHVGLLLDHQTIIHATDTTGRVVIDRLDNGGIISLMLRRRTHNLRVVKRILCVNS